MGTPANNTPSRSILMRFLIRSWEYRHPRAWVTFRLACGVWNLILGAALLAAGRWLGPLALVGLVPLGGAALIFWTAYRLQTSVRQ